MFNWSYPAKSKNFQTVEKILVILKNPGQSWFKMRSEPGLTRIKKDYQDFCDPSTDLEYQPGRSFHKSRLIL